MGWLILGALGLLAAPKLIEAQQVAQVSAETVKRVKTYVRAAQNGEAAAKARLLKLAAEAKKNPAAKRVWGLVQAVAKKLV